MGMAKYWGLRPLRSRCCQKLCECSRPKISEAVFFSSNALLLTIVLPLGQRESDINSPRCRFRIFPTARRDYHELPPIYFIRGGRGVARKPKPRFPEQLAGPFIERAEFFA